MTRSATARCSSKADEAGDELESRDDLGSERGEPSGEAARGAGPGERGDVHAEIGSIARPRDGRDERSAPRPVRAWRPFVEQRPLLRRGTWSSRRRRRRARRLGALHVSR